MTSVNKNNSNKLLIVSSKFDHSTSMVIEWLLYYGISFERFNGEHPFEFLKINLSSTGEIEIIITGFDGQNYNLSA